jgi:hypothetical protein
MTYVQLLATETHDPMRNHDKDLSLSATPNCSSHLIRNHFCSRLITILAIVFVCVCTSSVSRQALQACVPCFDFSSTFRRDDIRTRDYNRNPRSDAESLQRLPLSATANNSSHLIRNHFCSGLMSNCFLCVRQLFSRQVF